jgi:hypothetical protein
MKKKIIIVVALGIILIGGCEKDTTVIIPKNPAATVITRTVSFSKDLQPIFSSSCAISGCHVEGGQTPNLASGSAYGSLINGSFLNKSAPASSTIYERLIGKITPAMPLNAPESDPGQIEELLLAWITQGAKNN